MVGGHVSRVFGPSAGESAGCDAVDALGADPALPAALALTPAGAGLAVELLAGGGEAALPGAMLGLLPPAAVAGPASSAREMNVAFF